MTGSEKPVIRKKNESPRKNFDFAQILHNSKFSIYNQKQAGRSWGGAEGSFGLPAPGCGWLVWTWTPRGVHSRPSSADRPATLAHSIIRHSSIHSFIPGLYSQQTVKKDLERCTKSFYSASYKWRHILSCPTEFLLVSVGGFHRTPLLSRIACFGVCEWVKLPWVSLHREFPLWAYPNTRSLVFFAARCVILWMTMERTGVTLMLSVSVCFWVMTRTITCPVLSARLNCRAFKPYLAASAKDQDWLVPAVCQLFPVH